MKVGIVIPAYGDDSWIDLAWSRAWPSTHGQGAHSVEVIHAETLAEARNGGAKLSAAAGCDWLCFLDADDELAPGYLAAMSQAASALGGRENAAQGAYGVLLVPRVQYVRGRTRQTPRFPKVSGHRHECDEGCMYDGNWLVIGTLVPTEDFFRVGGFEEWPVYEDWALFARLVMAGAVTVRVPGAVYVGHRRPHSRNHASGRTGQLAAHHAIRRAVFPDGDALERAAGGTGR